ncbi:metallophosphoesterase family protein [Lelliottia nimipressuralis]
METGILILRFRDTTDGIDTIEDHQSIIDNCGAVWWGWWKQEKEILSDIELEYLNAYKHDYIFLINRDLNKIYKATISRIIHNQTSELNLSQVPSYYSQKSKEINTWFLIKNLTVVPRYNLNFDEAFAKNGNPTYLFLEEGNKNKSNHKDMVTNRVELHKNHILVISDLHFGENYGFCYESEVNKFGQTKSSLTRSIMKDLGELGIADKFSLLLITGDLTTKGDWSTSHSSKIKDEIHSLCNSLNIEHDKILSLPGNHDMVRYSTDSSENIINQVDKRFERDYRTFIEELSGRSWRENLSYNAHFKIKDIDKNLDITILNSCGIVSTSEWTEYGYVGQEGIDAINNLSNNDKDTFRMLALHHHLLPVNDIDILNKKGISLTVDSLRIMKSAISKNIKLAMHGHQHIFNMSNYTQYERSNFNSEKSLRIISNGSVSVDQQQRMNGERNSYSIVEVTHSGFNVIVRELVHGSHKGVTIMKTFIN